MRKELHSRKLRRAVRFALVASPAGDDAVSPARLASEGTRDDVVDRHLVEGHSLPAVLASMTIAPIEIAAGERDLRLQEAIAVGQDDHFRNTDAERDGLDARVAIRHRLRNPRLEIIELVPVPHDACEPLEREDERAFHGADAHRTPALVEDQSRLREDGHGTSTLHRAAIRTHASEDHTRRNSLWLPAMRPRFAAFSAHRSSR